MGLTLWVATTRSDGPACQRRSKTGGGRLWKRRSVEKSFGLSHLAWESRLHRGIPTFPQSRRRCSLNLKPDISCALKSGHFDLLTTGRNFARDAIRHFLRCFVDDVLAVAFLLKPINKNRFRINDCCNLPEKSASRRLGQNHSLSARMNPATREHANPGQARGKSEQ